MAGLSHTCGTSHRCPLKCGIGSEKSQNICITYTWFGDQGSLYRYSTLTTAAQVGLFDQMYAEHLAMLFYQCPLKYETVCQQQQYACVGRKPVDTF